MQTAHHPFASLPIHVGLVCQLDSGEWHTVQAKFLYYAPLCLCLHGLQLMKTVGMLTNAPHHQTAHFNHPQLHAWYKASKVADYCSDCYACTRPFFLTLFLPVPETQVRSG